MIHLWLEHWVEKHYGKCRPHRSSNRNIDGRLHIPSGTLMEDEKVAPLSLSDQLPSAQGLLQANTAKPCPKHT